MARRKTKEEIDREVEEQLAALMAFNAVPTEEDFQEPDLEEFGARYLKPAFNKTKDFILGMELKKPDDKDYTFPNINYPKVDKETDDKEVDDFQIPGDLIPIQVPYDSIQTVDEDPLGNVKLAMAGLYSPLNLTRHLPNKREKTQFDKPEPYPYQGGKTYKEWNPDDESKQEVPQQVAQQAPTAQQPMVIMQNPANFEAISRQNTALWDYAVYRAANGDRSLFDKLVSDAEARREKEKERRFQEAENEKNRQSNERMHDKTRDEANTAAFDSARSKAERALRDLNDINDSTKSKWANGTITADDVLNLRRAYRAYQFALDEAEMAARKVSTPYNSGEIFDMNTGDMGVNLDALKSLEFNSLYNGERNIPLSVFDLKNTYDSSVIKDALNSNDPAKAKEAYLMVSDKMEKFRTNHQANVGYQDIQNILNEGNELLSALDAVKPLTTNQKRKNTNAKDEENEQLDFVDLKKAINALTGTPAEVNKKARALVTKHNNKHKTNYSWPNSFKAGK